ncbi:MAG: DNA primase, partial [Clostridia bacterium]|nr:DNA primase [Clostridia bacterium]
MTNLFEALYGSCETGWLSTWVLQDKKTRWYPVKDYDQALKEGLQLAQAKAYDIYFGVGLREKNLGQWKRGHSETITTIPALWVDIDIAGESHKKTSLP